MRRQSEPGHGEDDFSAGPASAGTRPAGLAVHLSVGRVGSPPVAGGPQPADRPPAAPVAAAPQGTAAPMAAEPLTDAEFSSAVAAVTGAFGDPTRRQIYLFVREHDAGATASEVAARFNLHPNVARHHLDKLAAGGYLEVFVPRPAGGAGRPSKHYQVSGQTTGVELPHRSDDLMVILLGRALAMLPPAAAEAMAEEVGEDYGQALAARMAGGEQHRSFRAALHSVAEALTAHGFAAHAEAREGTVALIRDSCPFFDTARQHPVICAVDRGMVRGMLSGLWGHEVRATESSRALGDDTCATFV